MNLSLDVLQILDAIERNGSFQAAADELHRVRTALTYSVNKLEQKLGVQIFDRSGHRAKLTNAGKMLLDQGRHILEMSVVLEQKMLKVGQGWEPQIRLSFDEALNMDGVMQMLDQFYTECQFTELDVRSHILYGGWEQLVQNKIDIALGISGEFPASHAYATQSLGAINFCFAVAKNHPLAEIPGPLLPEQIQQYPSVVVSDSAENAPRQSYGVISGQRHFRVSSMQQKIKAQINGSGIGFIPEPYAKIAARENKLVIKEVAKEKGKSPVIAIWQVDKQQGNAMQWLIQYLKKHRASLF